MAKPSLPLAVPVVCLLLSLSLSLPLLAVRSEQELPSAASDAAALLSFKSSADPSGRLLFAPLSPGAGPTPCRWPGVSCSASGRVTRLVLESLALNGTFPAASLSRLDQLRVLSLRLNALSGPVPDLSPLAALKALFLDRNRLSGPFPASLLALRRLRTLDLSHNLLSGPLPLPLASLPRLAVLRLDSNRFAGPVPPFNQSSLKSLNLSSNALAGPVPATPVLSAFGPSPFLANPALCGALLRRQCGSRIAFFPRGPAAPSPASPPSATASTQGFLLSQSSSPPSSTPHKHALLALAFMSAAIFLIAFLVLILAVRKIRRP